MHMKIMVCGKGGSGKSAVTVLAARTLSSYYRVYVVDSDESNTLLYRLLGVDSPRPLVEYLGGKGSIFKRGEVDIVKALATAGGGIRLRDLPSEYLSASPEGVKLATVGKVREFGEGCACPFNFFTKTLLKHLCLESGEIVLVDTDAGVEHLGRGVADGCDALLTVADPTAEALELAKTLSQEAAKLKKTFWLVINKVTPPIADVVQKKAKAVGLDVVGVIRFDEDVFRSCLIGENLKSQAALLDVHSLLERVSLIEKEQ